MNILGEGKDGLVIYPPLPCEIDIDRNKFVGKIYWKLSIPSIDIVMDKINKLPDELNGLLYYKENYVCDVDLPENLKSIKRLSNRQLLLRKVEGKPLGDAISDVINDIKNNNYCQFYDLFKASIETFYHIKQLASYNVFYNDFSTSNIIYNNIEPKLMLIDLDDISYGQKGIPKSVLRNKDNTYKPNYVYDDKYGYINWDYDYTKSIINNILSNTFEAYNPSTDADMYNTYDQETKNKFDFVKEKVEKIVGKPYKSINFKDIDLINSKLDVLKNELCGTSGGKKKRKIKIKIKRTRTRTRTRTKTRTKTRIFKKAKTMKKR